MRVRDNADWFGDWKEETKQYPNHLATLGYSVERVTGKEGVIRSYKISVKP